jgi:hypothetical protein
MALLKEYDMYVEVLDGGRVAITPRSPQTVVGKRP